MADKIVQKLGLDATQALSAIRTLSQAFGSYAANVTAAANANAAFNKSGRAILESLRLDSAAASEAVKAIAGLAKAQDQAALAADRAAQAEARAAAARVAQGRATRIQKTLGGDLTKGLSGDTLTKANQLVAKIAQIGARANLSATQINALGNNLSKAFIGPQAQIVKLLNQLQQLRSSSQTAGGGFGALGSNFVQAVVGANLLSGAISSIKTAMVDGLKTAIQYELQLARIKTIAGSDVGSINELNAGIRALSDQFGLPIVEVAAGQYELLSNQIGNAAETTQVLESALKLSNVTGATTAQSVNAISSVLNSYNLTASQSEVISAKLFRAVDLGRFTLAEVADSMGRVTVTAAQLGVSFDEVLASLATLTITGVPAEEAMTLLGNAIRGLLKPTEGMQEAFKELGVANAEAGVQAFGLLGFLDKLSKTSGGTASEITQLTENIRVARGVIGLTGDQADRAAKNLEQISKATGDLLNTKNDIIISTNAKQVETELTQLKNFFVVDLGQNALAAITAILKPLGGSVTLFKAVAAAAGIYAASLLLVKLESAAVAANTFLATASLTSISASFQTATASALAFTAALLPLALIGVSVFALAKTFTDLGTEAGRTRDAINTAFAGQAKQLEEQAKLADQIARVQVDRDKELLSEKTKNLQKFVIDAQALYNKDTANALSQQKIVKDSFQDQLTSRVQAYEKYVGELANADDRARKVSEDSFNKITDLVRGADTSRFERSLTGLSDTSKVDAQLRRVNSLLSEAANLQRQGTKESIARAEAIRTEAAGLADSAASGAAQLRDRVRLKQAENEITEVLNAQVRAESARAQNANATAAAAAGQLAKEKQNLSEIKSLEEQIKKVQDSALTNTKLSSEERIAAFRKAIPLAQQLEDRLSKAGDVNLAKNLGVSDLLQSVRQPLIDALGKEVPITIAATDVANQLQTALTNREFVVKVTPVIEALTTASGVNVAEAISKGSGLDKIQSAIAARSKQADTSLEKSAGLNTLQTSVTISKNNILRDLAQLENEFRQAGQGINTSASTITQAIQRLGNDKTLTDPVPFLTNATAAQERLAAAATAFAAQRQLINVAIKEIETKGAAANVAPIQQQLDALAKSSKDNPKLAETFTALGIAIGQFAQDTAKLQGAAAQVQAGAALRDQLLSAEQALQEAATAQGTLADQTNAAASAAATGATNSQAQTTALNAEAAAASKAAAAQQQLNRARSGATGGAPAGFAKGGPVGYFAAGGGVDGSMFKARGTDTIPAMLSPGEFVVNASSTRKFFSQLVAMNSGRQPVYRANGGPVTNVSIGDVNVNSQGSSGQSIGRDIARTLNREIRKGTIRLN